MEGSGVLRPLDEVASSVRRLYEYETRDDLSRALEQVHAAVQRAVRLRLRADPTAPESQRLCALSEDQLPMDEVVRSLRTRNLISLHLAGTLHELDSAAARAREGAARPDDAVVALRAVDRIREEFGAVDRASPPPPGAAAGTAISTGPEGASHTEPTRTPPFRVGRWMAWLAAVCAVLLLVGFAWVLLRGFGDDLGAGIVAFRAGRLDSAEVLFRRTLARNPRDVTALLYVGRIERRQGQFEAAAATLRKAAAEAPQDPAVRRELGHLFMDLGRPRLAARQYQLALDEAPDQDVNWVALIQALRAARDPRAEELLRRAPAEVRKAFGYSPG